MKINLIPTNKLALLSAAFCAAMLAFSHNASALTFGDGQQLGYVTGPAVADAGKTALINQLIGQALGTNEPLAPYTTHRSNNDFGTLPNASVTGAVSGTGTNITIGSGLYSYLFATYSNGPQFIEVVWYIGNLSGDITIPGVIGFDFSLNGWTLLGTGGQGVPDGGTTVMLLGAALGALGMARRFLKA